MLADEFGDLTKSLVNKLRGTASMSRAESEDDVDDEGNRP